MLTNWICLDIATAPLPEAGSYLEPGSAQSNYWYPEKIAAYFAEREAEQRDRLALDLDLCRMTGFALRRDDDADVTAIMLQDGESAEQMELASFADELAGLDWHHVNPPAIITFGGLRFDLPVLMRRARYLGMDFPVLNLDRYRTPHVDLCDLLSDRDPSRRRSLDFYVKRLGWTDLLPKPLAGADEAKVFETGRWDLLAASVRRDVTAIYRLAQWAGVIAKQQEPEPIL
jgi:hypothetical protein